MLHRKEGSSFEDKIKNSKNPKQLWKTFKTLALTAKEGKSFSEQRWYNPA